MMTEVRLAEMSSMGIGNKPCLDIRPSADQINDRSISVAQLSKSKFAIHYTYILNKTSFNRIKWFYMSF